MPGPVLGDGLRPIDVPRVAARHRGQLASASASAVPHGVSLSNDFEQYAGPCERHATVEDLCGLQGAVEGAAVQVVAVADAATV